MKKLWSIILILALLCAAMPVYAEEAPARSVRIAFTHDIHSYLDAVEGSVEGTEREYGGISRLASILKQKTEEAPCGADNVLYLDGGDFSQGTLFQAGYETSACELMSLVSLGYTAVTPGNHEWDHAGNGFANMLDTAVARAEAQGLALPAMLIANIDFTGELNDEQRKVNDVLERYAQASGQESIGSTVVTTGNGLKIGLFGVSGPNSIEDSPTSGMKWLDYIETAKSVAAELRPKCDILICLSHSGASSDGQSGDDSELAKACPEIDMIVSGHSHTVIREPALVGNTLIASAGEYLKYAGCVDVSVAADGKVSFSGYGLTDVDGSVEKDAEEQAVIDGFKADIRTDYLAQYGYDYDQVLAYCPFDFISLDEMYATHDEYPMGNLIADSYLYEARRQGIDDIAVALVGLGTIRGSFSTGYIDTAEAFGICSLGAGEDGSAGHPLLTAYITGAELRLLVELDASLGPMVSSIKMSYSGLEYKFNAKRTLLDRVTEIYLVQPDGSHEKIRDDALYKVCCNMYAANMLGMLNGLTKGILSIVPKYEDGTPVTDFYTCSMKDAEGRAVKEWVAFADYLNSFESGEDGIPVIPDMYNGKLGRKVKTEEAGLAAIKNPGTTTLIFCALGWIVIIGEFFLIRGITRRVKKRRAAKAEQENIGK